MTNKEIIEELLNIRDNFNYTLCPNEVFDMAIKALEQEKEYKHQLFVISETCIDVDKCHISAENAIKKIQKVLRGEL